MSTRSSSVPRIQAAVLVLVLASFAILSQGAEPLHLRIDRAVVAGSVSPLAEAASETAFLRRIYLDLTGSIPSAEEVRTYLQNEAPNKRVDLINHLLESREFHRHMAVTFDLWLMERLKDTHVKTAEWREFLTESFAANKPYHELMGEILSADGTPEKNRAASRFLLDRLGEPHQMTRDVGRLLFGQDLQCAQCHDHPTISDYLQRDYYGLYAFFNRSYLFQPDKKKPASLAEKAEGASDFKSVFTDAPGEMRPRLLGSLEIDEPKFLPGEEYIVAPDKKDKNLKPVPKYSRRSQIAGLATDGTNSAFNRNVVNRLWGHMMGRGIVEPYDFHHAANPPANPVLLDLLEQEFVRMNYDIRAFLGELARTKAYRRSFEAPERLVAFGSRLKPRLEEFRTDAELRGKENLKAAAALESAKETWEAARIEFAPLQDAAQKAETTRNAGVEPLQKVRAEFEALRPDVEALAAAGEAVEQAQSLSGAFPELTARLGKRLSEIAVLEKTLRPPYEAKQKELAAAEEKLTKLNEALSTAEKNRQSEQEKVHQAQGEMETALATYQAAKSAARLADRRYQTAEELVELAQLANEAERTRTLAELQKTELAQLQSEAERARLLATHLETAVSAAAAASDQVPEDAGLARALEVLKLRSRDAQSRAASTKASHSAHQQEVETSLKEAEKLAERFRMTEDALNEKQAASFSVGVFGALTPEQLALSMVKATGYRDRLISGGHSAFDKKLAAQKDAKAPEEGKEPPPKLTEDDRQREVEAHLDMQLKSIITKFVGLFGGQAGLPQTDFYATADQALFFENDSLLRGWLRPSGDNLAGRLGKLTEPADVAEELYLSVLTRYPSPEEITDVATYLAARPEDRVAAMQDLAWALLSSIEFRFKH